MPSKRETVKATPPLLVGSKQNNRTPDTLKPFLVLITCFPSTVVRSQTDIINHWLALVSGGAGGARPRCLSSLLVHLASVMLGGFCSFVAIGTCFNFSGCFFSFLFFSFFFFSFFCLIYLVVFRFFLSFSMYLGVARVPMLCLPYPVRW